MRSRLVTNLILLAVIVVLVMATLTELKPEKAVPTAITQLDTQTVSSIELTRRGKPPLRFAKQQEEWVMLSPENGKANQEKVKNLLTISQINSSSQFPLNSEKADRFGLKEPAITLKLGGLLIMVGDIAPISQQRYLRIGETLYLVTDNFYHHLIAQPSQYLAATALKRAAD
ncbi:MAG: hypothetical protein DRQ61_03565 [Gammaproteobacteria bacterium]|nr:MAG: hypothetical protein DRQ56_00795 [Gammaproteobacteria bacterium]RLA23529.1 MAG: hypothetical protein DRQ61_03565 [Gammaproteobacteria bacterium]